MAYTHGLAYAQVDVADVQNGLLRYAWASRGKLKKYLVNDVCPMLESYMKHNHKWQNRTRTAEEGLTADVVESAKGVKDSDYSLTVRVYHTAYHNGFPYGEMLEHAYDERYAILEPTVRNKGGEVVEGMEGLLNEVGFYEYFKE